MQNEAKIKLIIHILFRKTWFFANDSKHKHIICRWKSFFTTNKDSRWLPQSMAPFDSNLLSKFHHFAWKKRAYNSDTFVMNGGYHYNEVAKRNWLAPRNGGRGGQRQCFMVALSCSPHEQLSAVVGGTSATREQSPSHSAPSGSFQQARACQLVTATMIGSEPWVLRKERDRDPWREEVIERERETGGGRETYMVGRGLEDRWRRRPEIGHELHR